VVAALIPKDVNPFNLMMSYAFVLVDVEMVERSSSLNGSRDDKGAPETVATDQAIC
jgi:hypothetical protein